MLGIIRIRSSEEKRKVTLISRFAREIGKPCTGSVWWCVYMFICLCVCVCPASLRFMSCVIVHRLLIINLTSNDTRLQWSRYSSRDDMQRIKHILSIYLFTVVYIFIYIYIYLGCRIRYFCYTLYTQYIYAVCPLRATKGLTIGTSLFLFPSSQCFSHARRHVSCRYISRIKDRGRKMLRRVSTDIALRNWTA